MRSSTARCPRTSPEPAAAVWDALVPEAYLKLVDPSEADGQSRTHCFAVSARAIRHIITCVREAAAEQRAGEAHDVPFDEGIMAPQESAETLIAIDRALDKLAKRDDRMAKVVELRCFGGMSQNDRAAALDVSHPNVAELYASRSRPDKAARYRRRATTEGTSPL